MGIEGDYSLEITYDSDYYEFILENPNFDVSIDTTVTEVTTGAIDSIICEISIQMNNKSTKNDILYVTGFILNTNKVYKIPKETKYNNYDLHPFRETRT